MMECSTHLDILSQSDRIDNVITLFPFDRLLPEKHAVNPDIPPLSLWAKEN
jgi:hypothetical protein